MDHQPLKDLWSGLKKIAEPQFTYGEMEGAVLGSFRWLEKPGRSPELEDFANLVALKCVEEFFQPDGTDLPKREKLKLSIDDFRPIVRNVTNEVRSVRRKVGPTVPLIGDILKESESPKHELTERQINELRNLILRFFSPREITLFSILTQQPEKDSAAIAKELGISIPNARQRKKRLIDRLIALKNLLPSEDEDQL